MVKVLRERIRRNPRRSQRKLALQLKISPKTIRKALKVDLRLKPLKRGTCHMLTIAQKTGRVTKCKKLLKRHGKKKIENILFTDEKIFNVEESYNRQNDRIYAKSAKDIPKAKKKVKRAHHPGYVMVWAGVSCKGKADLHFVEKGVKVRAKNYVTDVLESVVNPLINICRWNSLFLKKMPGRLQVSACFSLIEFGLSFFQLLPFKPTSTTFSHFEIICVIHRYKALELDYRKLKLFFENYQQFF